MLLLFNFLTVVNMLLFYSQCIFCIIYTLVRSVLESNYNVVKLLVILISYNYILCTLCSLELPPPVFIGTVIFIYVCSLIC